MLFAIGPVLVEDRPFNADDVKRDDAADYVDHDVLGRRKVGEYMGPGEDALVLKGTLMPFHRGKNGLPTLEVLRGLMATGQPVYCLRGDGYVLGWRRIVSLSESSSMLQANGVGGVVAVEFKLIREDEPGPDAMTGLVNSLLSLFG